MADLTIDEASDLAECLEFFCLKSRAKELFADSIAIRVLGLCPGMGLPMVSICMGYWGHDRNDLDRDAHAVGVWLRNRFGVPPLV